jgi:hypothetical protein
MQYNYIDWDARKKPYPMLTGAIDLLHKINGEVVVEIGSMRTPIDGNVYDFDFKSSMEGHSSLLFAISSQEFHTVDIDMDVSKTAFKILKKLNTKNWNVYNGDGIKFLKEFKNKIDLLFLDAWDVGTQDYAENHLKAYEAAKPHLSKQHIILIDDTDIGQTPERGMHIDEECMGGKGKILIPFLLKNGYKVQFKGRQTCLTNF